LLLLQAEGALEHRTVDRSRLNRRRRSLKRPPLFDHRVARLRIAPETPGLAGTRAPARAHVVRGHFVVRRHRTADGAPRIYWRRAHLRGHG
jgi:hypothetical protein